MGRRGMGGMERYGEVWGVVQRDGEESGHGTERSQGMGHSNVEG